MVDSINIPLKVNVIRDAIFEHAYMTDILKVLFSLVVMLEIYEDVPINIVVCPPPIPPNNGDKRTKVKGDSINLAHRRYTVASKALPINGASTGILRRYASLR